MSEIDIVITSYFRPDFTLECLNRIEDYTEMFHRVIVVDNGSSQQTRDMLWDAKDSMLLDVLVLLDRNYGLEPAKNIGLSLVRSDLYIDMDNDIYVNEGWVEKLLALKEKYPEYAAIAAHPQTFVGDDINLLLKDTNEIREYSKCGASARLMDTKLVKEVGGWRNEGELKTLTRGEEYYICGKLKEKGHKVGYARDVAIQHDFGDSNWGYGKEEHYHSAVWPQPSNKLYG